MENRYAKSAALFERATHSIAGGVNSGIRKLEKPYPLYFTHGKGSRLFDVDGNNYIDYQIGQGAILVGHSHPHVVEAIRAQAEKGTHWAAQSELEIDVAEIMQKNVPACERIRFSNSATEALIAVLRLARASTGRMKMLRFEGHYHGWGDEGLIGFASAPDKWGTIEEPNFGHPSQGVPTELSRHQVLAQWNNIELLDSIFEKHGNDIAGIICEPLMCNSGCIEPKEGFLKKLRELADKHGCVLIFDETITGFRFGMAGAEGWSGVRPDLCVFGKAIANGMPFAALGGKLSLMDLIANGKVVHAGTLNGNPLCLAAAKATLEVLTDHGDFVPALRKRAQRLMTGLKEKAQEQGIDILPYGPGPAFQVGVDLEKAPTNYREAALTGDKAKWTTMRERLLDEGVRAIERGLWFVSLAITDSDIDETLEKSSHAFAKMKG